MQGWTLHGLCGLHELTDCTQEHGCLVNADLAELRIEWADGQWATKFGRIRALRIKGVEVFIGPHWYCSVIMLVVILGVGTLFLAGVAWDLGWLNFGGGLFAMIGSAHSFLACALADPGILRHRPNSPGESTNGSQEALQFMPSTGNRRCGSCDIVQPKGALHCEYCHVCIAEHDHHCPWMSKCVGRGNLSQFYSFLCFAISSLIYIVVATITSTV